MQCPKCKGTSWIMRVVSGHHTEDAEIDHDICPVCDGTGEISQADPITGLALDND